MYLASLLLLRLTLDALVTYIDSKGRRVTTENSYLTPAVLARPNLTVAVGASVTRILFDTTQKGAEPRAIGVEFCSGPQSPRFIARARKEVVLSYVSCFHPIHTVLNAGPVPVPSTPHR